MHSIPYSLKQGTEVKIRDGALEVTKENLTIKFDMKLKSGLSYLMCANMTPLNKGYHKRAMVNEEEAENKETTRIGTNINPDEIKIKLK